MEIFQASKNDIPVIMDVAEATWKQTYAPIISREQIDYMYGRMYTPEALAEQMDAGIHFLIAAESGESLAFIAYEYRLDTAGIRVVYVPKLYVKPSVQRRHIGKILLDEVTRIGREHGCECIELNVNRNNPARHFYEKLGFIIFQTVDLPYDKFWLNDYVMRKAI